MKTIKEILYTYISNQEEYISTLVAKNKIDYSSDREEYINILLQNLARDRDSINTIENNECKFFHNFHGRSFALVGESEKKDHLLVKQVNSRSKKTYRMHISEILNNI